jgi:hypothetical protein
MAKAKVKLDFIELTVPEKIQYGRDRVGDMTGNGNFTTPDIPLADITTACDNLQTTYNAAQGGGPTETAAQNAAEAVWDDLMRKEAAYVTRIADGSVVIITSAGFTPTETEATPTQPPAKPENFTAKHSDQSGAILLNNDTSPNVRGYVTIVSSESNLSIQVIGDQIAITGNTEPVIIQTTSARKISVTNLTSGRRYYIIRYAFNAAGRGPDSDKIAIVAP